MSYGDFLARKRRIYTGHGIGHQPTLPSALYPWQAQLVRWALRKGRAALFADCGLGKTFMQVAWANALDVPTLLLAPLCVAEQTVGEAAKLGIEIVYAREQADARGRR
ncbi:MAG: helicase, partial [Actinobacteria bacterium]|nr:helicase [Actinomycetota bacterium]